MPESLNHEQFTRESTFSYTCNQCSRCCYDKRIQVNPYEIGRIAKNRNISTTVCIDTFLEPGEPYLGHQSNGACVFLTEQGCGVHADRPLVCRLYPLGQKRTGAGEESFHYATPHPQTEGVYGHHGTIGEFLDGQGVGPYLNARDRYAAMLYRLLDVLAGDIESDDEAWLATTQTLGEHGAIQEALQEWLNMDAVIARYCRACQLEEPENIEARLEIHLHAMALWITHHSTGGQHETHP